MVDVKISGAYTYKIKRYPVSDALNVYTWDSGTGEWNLQISIAGEFMLGECNIILETDRGEDKKK
jgi:hypothetical protein